MTWLFTQVLSWLSGGVLDRVLAYFERQATTEVESERVRAAVISEYIKAELEARKAASQIRLATNGYWEMRFITAIIAGCFTLHLVMVTLDTCFKLGWRVFAFPEPFNEWQGAIILSFFGIYTVGKGISAIAGAIALRKW
ncbi:hypothetical protein [Rhodoligotrophos ferricapiens]|uniref:hypothetical protein n=1 Tax=Rhodoligotrophos ferricapiens TaxID=3069264 RepID=UPI00315DF4BC